MAEKQDKNKKSYYIRVALNQDKRIILRVHSFDLSLDEFIKQGKYRTTRETRNEFWNN